jgi:DtxR family Mn-dependent transcriptional regulator
MDNRELSTAVQDYLRAIIDLESREGRATTTAVARRLGVSAPSASAMAKKLAGLGLVERAPYRGVVLTETGRRAALEMLRHHRLLERYLVETLDIPLHEVHDEADRLEHAISEELEARIDAALGHPTVDPHGDPIPDRDLALETENATTLLDLELGAQATVARVPDRDVALLLYLAELALLPGRQVEVAAVGRFNGPVSIRTENGEHAIGREVAAAIHVAAA